MKDIQIGDTITTYIDLYKERREVVILYAPQNPGEPWIVREVENGRKWRLWTDGNMIKTFSRSN